MEAATVDPDSGEGVGDSRPRKAASGRVGAGYVHVPSVTLVHAAEDPSRVCA